MSSRSRRAVRTAASSLLAGVAGTAAMGVLLQVERRLRGGREAVGHPMDYDSSKAPLRAVESVTGRDIPEPVRPIMKWALHWGYGSGAALGRSVLAGAGVPEPQATLAFWGLTEGMAMVMFPLTGASPPAWRWRQDMLITSLIAHLVYAVGVSAALPVAGKVVERVAPSPTSKSLVGRKWR